MVLLHAQHTSSLTAAGNKLPVQTIQKPAMPLFGNTIAVVAVIALCQIPMSSTLTIAWPDFQPLPSNPGHFTSLGNHRFVITLRGTPVHVPVPVHMHSQDDHPGLRFAEVFTTVAWRRSDAAPLAKAVFVTAGINSTRVMPCRVVGAATRDAATVAFTPVAGEQNYALYYLSFTTCEYEGGSCRFDAAIEYVLAGASGSCASESASTAPAHRPQEDAAHATTALQGQYQSRTDFESFVPMGMPMTSEEVAAFLTQPPPSRSLPTLVSARNSSSTYSNPANTTRDIVHPLAVVVAEHREHPVRMRWRLPHRWTNASIHSPSFSAAVQPGEHFTFQLAVHAPYVPVTITSVSFTDLSGAEPALQPSATKSTADVGAIPAVALRVFNMEGTDYWGRNITAGPLHMEAGEVKALWVALVVPLNTSAGRYMGTATVQIAVASPTPPTQHPLQLSVALDLNVTGQPLPDGGDGDIERMTRLHWLDSTLGSDASSSDSGDGDRTRTVGGGGRSGAGGGSVPAPYTSLHVTRAAGGSAVITMLGKVVTIGSDGLPTSIIVQHDSDSSNPANTSRWIHVFESGGAGTRIAVPGLDFVPHSTTWSTPTAMSVTWRSVWLAKTAPRASLMIEGVLDATGYMSFNATLANSNNINSSSDAGSKSNSRFAADRRVTGGGDNTNTTSLREVQNHFATGDAIAGGVELTVTAAPTNTHWGMGLGKKGGSFSTWFNGEPAATQWASWIVLDFGETVSLDGVKLSTHGDGLHDPKHMLFQAAVEPPSGSSVSPGVYAWAGGQAQWLLGNASRGTPTAPTMHVQTFEFGAPVAGRWWRWVVLDCWLDNITTNTHSNAMVAEIEFHEHGKGYRTNTGTKTSSLVVASESSGQGNAGNPMWQGVDGVVKYKTGVCGYDARLSVLQYALPPMHDDNAKPPRAAVRTDYQAVGGYTLSRAIAGTGQAVGNDRSKAQAQIGKRRQERPQSSRQPNQQKGQPQESVKDAITWKWDGVNGNNCVWLGSTKAGLRVYLKGDDPLWQAGVPFDSTQSPTPPTSWSNSGAGGVQVHGNGTVVAFSGHRLLPVGRSVSYAWPMLATPAQGLS